MAATQSKNSASSEETDAEQAQQAVEQADQVEQDKQAVPKPASEQQNSRTQQAPSSGEFLPSSSEQSTQVGLSWVNKQTNFIFLLSTISSMPLALYNRTHTHISLNTVNTYTYIYI